jgi:hypothetical protein
MGAPGVDALRRYSMSLEEVTRAQRELVDSAHGKSTHRDPLDLARESRRHGDEANLKQRGAMGALGTLFGSAVLEAVHRFMEPAVDNLDDACRHYEDVVAGYHDELVRERERFTETHIDLTKALVQLSGAVAVTKQRHARSRRPLPEWVGEAEAFLAPFTSEEPF